MISITKEQRDFIKSVFDRYCPDAQIIVFGSRVKGTHAPHSDLDVTIRGEEPMEGQVLFNIGHDFEQSDLPFIVDVSDFHQLSGEFQNHICEEYEEL